MSESKEGVFVLKWFHWVLFTLLFISLAACTQVKQPEEEEVQPEKVEQSAPLPQQEFVPVLMYHTFEESPTFEGINVNHEQFESHLKWLKEEGYTTISNEQLAAYMKGELELPEKAIQLTIDDGYQSVYDTAYPLLKQYGFEATLYVITSHIQSGERFGVPMANWEQLKEMSDSNVIHIGSHTHDLHWRGNVNEPGFEAMTLGEDKDGKVLSPDERVTYLEKDLTEAHELIKEKIGVEPKSFAYPYGAYDEVVERVVASFNYLTVPTVERGVNRVGDSPARVKRYNMSGFVDMERFKAIVNGQVAQEEMNNKGEKK